MKKPVSIFALLLSFLMQSLPAHAQKISNPSNNNIFGTWGHGDEISTSVIKKIPFIRGWNFTFKWSDLEPQKGKFDWKFFDEQLKITADNNLYIGFMVWVGQFSPEWLYTVDGVPKVMADDKIHLEIPYYPFYLSENYKKDYLNMLHEVGEHVKSLPLSTRNKLLFWMSAEGSTGDVTPYKATPTDPKYNISDQQWFDFKKVAWTNMYNFGKSINPQLNILINQANSGKYFDWLTANLSGTWFKAGSLAHTYQFTNELGYFKRLQKVVKPDNNGMANRFRGESESVQGLSWFKQSPQQNMFSIVGSCLHIGLDVLNVGQNIVRQVGNSDFPFRFFNKYAGQRDPASATGALCILRDVLDVADTKRFPENKFGSLTDSETEKYKIKKANREEYDDTYNALSDISNERKQKILNAFVAYGAKNGSDKEPDPKEEAKLRPKFRKENLRGDLQDKYNVDLGVNLLPGNYYKFLEQYSPNTTSRGYWRIGPADQPYGRYARGFDYKQGMTEMFFSLDNNFYTNNNQAHKMQVNVVYFDKGNGDWSLNYFNGKKKVEKYRVHCTNTNRWIIKTIELSDAYSNKKLEHNADFSLKYLSGDNTIFSMMEVVRK